MNKSKRFNNAIAALVKGYMENTLFKSSCSACAVGNMISHSMNIKIVNDSFSGNLCWSDNNRPYWFSVFCTTFKQQIIRENLYTKDAKLQIDSTGYSWKELARIEFAFETSSKITEIKYSQLPYETRDVILDADQLKGLMVVIDILCDIEEISQEKEINSYKKMFENAKVNN